MRLDILASGSKGNCYVLDDGYSQLMIECGIPIKKIKEGLDFDLSRVAGCILTHGHKDHCRAAADLCKAGIDVYMSAGTAQEIGVKSHRIKVVDILGFAVKGGWRVYPFSVKHDTAEPFGYMVIKPSAYRRLVFLTDSAYSPYVFSSLDYILVECNHDYESLGDSVATGTITKEHRLRVIQNHFSLENCIEFILANMAHTDRLKKIVLLHASDGNADTGKMIKAIQGATGVMTELAEAWKTIEL